MQKETKTQSARRQYDEHMAAAVNTDFSLTRRIVAAEEAMWFARYADLQQEKREQLYDDAHAIMHKLSESFIAGVAELDPPQQQLAVKKA